MSGFALGIYRVVRLWLRAEFGLCYLEAWESQAYTHIPLYESIEELAVQSMGARVRTCN